MNRNIVATITRNVYKDALLKKKCLRRSMNRIQSKDHKVGTYEINEICLSCFDDKIYIKKNGCDRFKKKTVILITIKKTFLPS